jgi:hypothetical protein
MEGNAQMRTSCLIVSIGVAAIIAISTARTASAQEAQGKNCRMEQQCHWKDFKKYCVWVKVCR